MMGRAMESYLGRRYRTGGIQTRTVVDRRQRESLVRERRQELLLNARDVVQDLGLSGSVAWVDRQLTALRIGTLARARAYDVVAQELEVAGRIQAGLLPERVPQLAGWDLAATLEPARETWGDFYDFIPLPGGRVAIVIGDVVDKGAGAALYMALTRTLLRSSAALHPDQPASVLETVNARILTETHSDMFVTVLYAVLDPETGTVAYTNGGHNPAHLFQSDRTHILAPTGMALGVLRDSSWQTRSVTLSRGDTLFLYTDGAIDARAVDGSSFGLERLLSTAQAHLGRPCVEIQDAVLDAIHRFVGGAPRYDDVTLLVVARG